MGEQKVTLLNDQRNMNRFIRMLLDDVEAMEHMLEHDWFESDISRIGAEQEMVLVNKSTFKPSSVAVEALTAMEHLPWVESELAKFNLEITLDPRVFAGDALAAMEAEIRSKLSQIAKFLDPMETAILLTGILPTLRKYDMEGHNLTPKRRYKALMDAIKDQNQGRFHELRLLGIDELLIKHNTPFIEACNTSFQVHLQIAPQDFVQMYNISQAVTAPILAIAANSPIVFGRRLWHETRIAMFQQSLDTRASNEHMRESSARVSFGTDWIHDSILDIYKEDIARFRPMLSGDEIENSLDCIRKGEVPKLRALQVHNSTVYRWNRPCYGVSPNGKPHLRIENRVLAAGPSVLDEMANAALWLGAMKGYQNRGLDARAEVSFSDVKDNFAKAARYGIDTKFSWFNDQKISAVELLQSEIIEVAREGLELMKINGDDITKYLNVIKGRADKHMTGARWMLRTFTHLISKIPRDEAITALTAGIMENQSQSKPVHEWKTSEESDLIHYKPSALRVDEFMKADLFTVQGDDLIDLIGEMMVWKRLRYVAVENRSGELIGLVSERTMLKHLLKMRKNNSTKMLTAAEIMITEVHTVDPEASILEALRLFKEHGVRCLPVVRQKQLIGMITEQNFLEITSRLITRLDQ
jgi:CBS domain-containing protein